MQVSATEGYRRFSESGPGFSGLRHGPLRPARRAHPADGSRARRPSASAARSTQIDYLVPSLSDGKVVWGAYFKSGAIFLADARGRITRRIS